MIYEVKITNGTFEKIRLVKHDGEWVTDQESAESMVSAQINNAWKVVK